MKQITLASTLILAMSACNTNPLLRESSLEYGAPEFDKIKTEHYMPAFRKGIEEAKSEVTAIVENPDRPTFENTILALENSGKTLDRVSGIFFNVMEADSSEELQQIAEDVTPLLNEYSMFVNLNPALFDRVKEVYEHPEGLEQDQRRLLEKTYKSFVRGGALLSDADKAQMSELKEKLSLAQLRFSKNVLAANNAYRLNVTDEKDLAGLPDFLVEQAKETAAQHGESGWSFDLSYPMYGPFLRFSERSDLRKKMYLAYSTRATSGEFDNTSTVLEITDLRIKIAHLLGYETYADYVLEERMIKTPAEVEHFLNELLTPSLPVARK